MRRTESGWLGGVKLRISGKDPRFQNITMPIDRSNVLQIFAIVLLRLGLLTAYIHLVCIDKSVLSWLHVSD